MMAERGQVSMDQQAVPPRDLVELVGRCLAFRLEPAELAALREQLFSAPGVWAELTDFAACYGLVQAVEQSLRTRGLLPSALLPPQTGPSAADRSLRAAATGLAQRREVLARTLRETIASLNRIGIEPIVIKGAQSLLTGKPEWRYMVDFDLLVPDRAEEAQAELLASGFEVWESDRERTERHHLPALIRKGFPGGIEIHRRAGNQYLRSLLPTRELIETSLPVAEDGMCFRLLPSPLHVLYCLLHHHIGHSGDARGLISLKGLYEFAWDMSGLGEADRAALKARADRHPRISAALDMWIAAAADIFGMPVETPLAVRSDAVRKWQGTLARMRQPRPWYKYPGYADEIRLGLAAQRVRAAPGGAYLPGRMWMRTKVIRSFFPRFTK
jgi:hypothetical protein